MDKNQLYPIFLKPDQLQFVVIGGGAVGFEKISSLLANCAASKIKLIAKEISPSLKVLAQAHSSLTLIEKPYESRDLDNADIVIAATTDHALNNKVWEEAKARKIIINIADTPDLCDFYMCSVVQKGDLKIGISTNGKSPTLSKRLREMLEETLPEEIDQLLDQLKNIRDQLKGDFEYKVQKMNEITAIFKPKTRKDHE